MPNVQDAPVILSGTVIALEVVTKFHNNVRGTDPDGLKVTIIAGDGIAIVKVSQDAVVKLAPALGNKVVWLVRNVPWAMETGSGMVTKFVRPVTFADLDLVNSDLNAAAGVVA